MKSHCVTMIKEAQQLGGEVEFCRWDVHRKDLIYVRKILSEFMVYAYAVLEQWFVRLEEYKL